MDDIRQRVANNLAKLMELSADCKSANALAKRSKIAQTTISNYLDPNRYKGYPTLDKLETLAHCFGVELWRLLHPTLGDKELTAKEIQLYRKWKADIEELRQ